MLRKSLKTYRLGRVAYDAYREEIRRQSPSGIGIPAEWHELGFDGRDAWQLAAIAVLNDEMKRRTNG